MPKDVVADESVLAELGTIPAATTGIYQKLKKKFREGMNFETRSRRVGEFKVRKSAWAKLHSRKNKTWFWKEVSLKTRVVGGVATGCHSHEQSCHLDRSNSIFDLVKCSDDRRSFPGNPKSSRLVCAWEMYQRLAIASVPGSKMKQRLRSNAIHVQDNQSSTSQASYNSELTAGQGMDGDMTYPIRHPRSGHS